MTLVKRNRGLFPSTPSFFDDFFTKDLFDWSNSNLGTSLPAVNISENDENYNVEVAAPGLKKDDFKVEVDNDVLTISSEKKETKEEANESERYSRKEFKYSSFRRSFALPEGQVDVDKIKAEYKDGILTLGLPKREEVKPQPIRTIKIS